MALLVFAVSFRLSSLSLAALSVILTVALSAPVSQSIFGFAVFTKFTLIFPFFTFSALLHFWLSFYSPFSTNASLSYRAPKGNNLVCFFYFCNYLGIRIVIRKIIFFFSLLLSAVIAAKRQLPESVSSDNAELVVSIHRPRFCRLTLSPLCRRIHNRKPGFITAR